MTDFHLAVVPVSDVPALRPVFDAVADIGAACQREVVGHDDLADSGEELQKSYQIQEDYHCVLLVACAGPAPADADLTPDGMVLINPDRLASSVEIVGKASVDLPMRDNLEIAFHLVEVAPDHRRRGIGVALSQALDTISRREGRTAVQAWTAHRDEADPDSPDALVAPTGAGALDRRDPVVEVVQRSGYRLEQTERHSQLDVPVDAALLTQLRDKAESASSGYRVLTWQGRTPPELLEDLAALRARMSIDIPSGEMKWEEEQWDAERVMRSDENALSVGRIPYMAVAQHVDTGQLVAYTRMVSPPSKAEVCYQGDTLVHGDHRGHRLGLLVKLANLAALTEVEPAVRRIHTWNAGENEWMLAINVALGFRRASTEGAWQKKYAS